MPPQTFKACIYGDQPQQDFLHLSTADLRSLKLKDLPIRVEHFDGQDVGRVTESHVTPDGRAYVTYELFETPAGWACGELITAGRLGQTSLKHLQLADGSKHAVEVSLVRQGARPGTNIYPDDSVTDYLNAADANASSAAGLAAVAASGLVVNPAAPSLPMADAAAVAAQQPVAAAPVAAVAAPVEMQNVTAVAAPVVPMQEAAAVAMPPASAEEPAAKRARAPDGRFVPTLEVRPFAHACTYTLHSNIFTLSFLPFYLSLSLFLSLSLSPSLTRAAARGRRSDG